MHERGKSDSPVVPAKLPNKAGRPEAEAVEERGLAEGNTDDLTRPGRSAGPGVSSGLDRVREVARRDKDARFTALLHHVDVNRLRSAYWAVRPQAAPGVDKVTWGAYGVGLEEKLQDLHRRVQSGSYRASPSRRVYIEKADGRLRPLGIATLEDKIVQRAVVEVLNAIYEEDFLGFSYGFRPGRSPHDALDALTVGIERRRVNWVLDADVKDFFTSLDHDWLARFVEHRVADKRVLRLIQKWVNAGVIEDGAWSESVVGAPQGASASPLLANVYLHYVLDRWARQWRRRHAHGEVIIVRFADDFVAGFEHKSDAEQFLTDLRERFSKFGLELHPDKTRLIEFGRNAARDRAARGDGKPGTFDFLGFTHMCGTTRKTGRFIVKRKTIRKRLSAKLNELKGELRRRWHQPVAEVGKWLKSVVQGYFNYHAVPGNMDSLNTFRAQVIWRWYRALRRRSQRDRMTWERFWPLVDRWIPSAKILHPHPNVRFDAKYPR
jgi:group II intron reverse transcriptase/maturase